MNLDYNTICISTATLVLPYIMEKFKIDMKSYGVIHTLFVQIIVFFTSSIINIYIDPIIITIALVVCIMISISYMFLYKTPLLPIKEKYSILTINDADAQKDFRKYIELNSDTWNQCINVSVGNMEAIIANKGLSNKNKIPEEILDNYDMKTGFDDPNLGAKGYYVYKQVNRGVTPTKTSVLTSINHTYIEINFLITETPIKPLQVFNKMRAEVNNKTVRLAFSKKFNNNSVSIIIHEGPRRDLVTLEKKYMHSFFHKNKDQLWEAIKNNILNPDYYEENGQVGRVSMLLYGPPGTGKSTLAYRVAMCLQRHVISIDLRGQSKAEIYREMFENVENRIFVFEEFDISVMELQSQENNINLHVSNLFKSFSGNKFNKKIKNSKSNDNESCNDNDNDSDSESKSEKKSSGLFNAKDYNNFRIRDLLELFQGTVSIKSSIIFATTNKYDEIKAICPELFRPGRLTPVYFGYVDIDTIQDISKYYFNKKIKSRLPEFIKIPTSQIIELALTYKIQENGFNKFEKDLLALF